MDFNLLLSVSLNRLLRQKKEPGACVLIPIPLRLLPHGGLFSGEHAEDESEGAAKRTCDMKRKGKELQPDSAARFMFCFVRFNGIFIEKTVIQY